MSKLISSKDLSETLNITLCKDGYWLYDATRGMNLAMQAKTQEDAFVEALTYYQKRLSGAEAEYKTLKSKVDNFVNQLVQDDDETDY